LKLLFDENLSPHLVSAMAQDFPGSSHVHECGLGSADDLAVWSYARDHGFTIVTKDADFQERSILEGHPPKIVWIRRGNCSTAQMEALLRLHFDDMRRLESDTEASILILL